MINLKVKLENCYGIKKLEKEFDFSSSQTYAIYAPNGMMKTSFSNAFKDLSAGLDSRDFIFPENITAREITNEMGVPIRQEQVFVIERLHPDFESQKVSSLLVNKDLKKEYDSIYLKLEEFKKEFLKNLKVPSGLKTTIEKEILDTFQKNDFFEILEEVESEVFNNNYLKFRDITYNYIFSDTPLRFLNTKDVKDSIKEYVEKYNELMNKSLYFRDGFDPYKAENVQESLSENLFFEAGHSINLFNGNKKDEIISGEVLQTILEEEKNRVLNDKNLQKKWDSFDKKFNANKELRTLKDYIVKNKDIIHELGNLEKFRKELWFCYFRVYELMFKQILIEYKLGKEKIREIIEKAKKEETIWQNVITIFKKRFFVPFELEIENKEDVLLKQSIPTIQFSFDGKKTSKENVIHVLSSGERRAFYILNVLFEIEARKKENLEHILVVDDIADSFDYKNKYAIIQYLKELSENRNFYLIILTHNFDFFRTIVSRGVVERNQCLMSYKKNTKEVILEEVDGEIHNPFIKDWKHNLSDSKKLIASISFARNLIEYTEGNTGRDYILLTSILHKKNNNNLITVQDLENIFKRLFPNENISLLNVNKKVIDLIYEEAELCLVANEGINFENKIVLSIAIRLKAEEVMIRKINDNTFLQSLQNQHNQTIRLFIKYKEIFPADKINIDLLERVILMTPENIHLNSFMYEPILDISDRHLINLFNELKKVP
jgi:ABC-type dipeptide/oligopeptide/nickel transport system ATPase subunit